MARPFQTISTLWYVDPLLLGSRTASDVRMARFLLLLVKTMLLLADIISGTVPVRHKLAVIVCQVQPCEASEADKR